MFPHALTRRRTARPSAQVDPLEPRRHLAADLTTPRVEVPINAEWQFVKQDVPGASARDFDASSWQTVRLPHTYNATDAQNGGNNYFRGVTWYRKRYRIPDALGGRQYYLKFEGVGHTAEVWVNGSRAGLHEGSYSAFVYDLNPWVQVGKANFIAVKVSNAVNPNLAPAADDWNLYGGIYRGVKLIAVDTAHVDPTDHGSPGVYLTQRDVSTSSAKLSVKTMLRSTSAKVRRFDVITTVFDREGTAVAEQTTRVVLQRKAATALNQSLVIANPKLWDGVRNPYLYTVRTRLRNTEGALLDGTAQRLGLRSFRVDPNEGLLLNGRPYDLRGVAMHQDRLNKGNAITDDDRRQDINLAVELGSTGLRLAHYQHAQFTYDQADERGLVVWAEIPVYNRVTNSAAFAASARQQLVELIRQNYNHPSILFWSLGNEIPNDELSRNLLADLRGVAKAEDPGRLTTYASKVTDKPINYVAELTALNRYDGWYAGEARFFGGALSQVHAARPDVAIGVSEYGAGGSAFQHVNDPNPPRPASTTTSFHPEQYLNVFHETVWPQLATRKWLWSKFVWALADFASDARNEGDQPGRVDKGLVTYDRQTKKDAFFYYKANWSNSPVLHITSRRYTQRDEPLTEVKVYSNAPAVELRVNGSLVGSSNTKSYAVFKFAGVALAPGANTVEVKAVRNGQTLTDKVTWTYTPPAGSRPTGPLAASAPPRPAPFATRPLVEEVDLV